MPLIETQTSLRQYAEQCKASPQKEWYAIQCEVLCRPLKPLFPQINIEELHYLLLSSGLCEPEEWKDVITTVVQMEDFNLWGIIEEEYNYLKKKWNGPEIPIFIFPIQKMHPPIDLGLPRKNGITFKEALFLFLSPSLCKEEVRSLLAHEYHHTCRLSTLKVKDEQLPLKDALVMEGLAEYAVQELYGERWLAPWTHLYSYKDVLPIWNKLFQSVLNTKGYDQRQIYLYGKADQQLPKWIGYNIGFQIIDSFCRHYPSFTSSDLLTIPSEELIKKSKFPYK